MGEENIIIIIKYEEQLLYSLHEFYFRLKHTHKLELNTVLWWKWVHATHQMWIRRTAGRGVCVCVGVGGMS